MKLIALYPILYHSKTYRIGEELPPNDADMTAAWLEAGTAKWMDEAPEPKKAAKAVLAAAEPGVSGTAQGGEAAPENLAGKVPKTQRRSRK